MDRIAPLRTSPPRLRAAASLRLALALALAGTFAAPAEPPGAPAPGRAPAATPAPAPAGPSGIASRRVVLVSFDGAGGLALAAQESAGTFGPDGFVRARTEGFSASRLEVVTPSLTAVSHAAISAGAPPSATGIVANWFHPAGTELSKRVSGFDSDSGAETLWEAAARQGKRVASIAWPGTSLKSPRSSTAVGLAWTEGSARSFLWKGPTPESPVADLPYALPVDVTSFSPPRGIDVAAPPAGGDAPLPIPMIHLAAIDTSDDGRRNYDTLLVLDGDGKVKGRARAGEWFAVTELRTREGADADVLYGRWCKVLALALDLSQVRIYVGGAARNDARPADFRKTLDREAGFWPGAPDPLLLEGDSPDHRSALEQAERLSLFFLEAFAIVERRGDWDLLLAYQPGVDEAAHALTLTDPRQPGYTPERAALAAATMREVWRIADRAAARYLRFAPLGDVVFVSDHGMRPIRRAVSLSALLAQHGSLKSEPNGRGGRRTAPDSKVDAVAGGGTGYVIVNRAGSMPGGVVSAAEAPALVDGLVSFLAARRDDEGLPLFSVVLPVRAAGRLELDHPNAGDVIVIGAGGTSIRGGFFRSGDTVLGAPDVPGQHGFDPDPALDGVLFHVGEGIAPSRAEVFPALGVAARVAGRLGIAPPSGKRP